MPNENNIYKIYTNGKCLEKTDDFGAKWCLGKNIDPSVMACPICFRFYPKAIVNSIKFNKKEKEPIVLEKEY